MKRLLILLSLLLFLGSWCQKSTPQAPIKIRSQQLMYEYLPNIADGDAKYKGKELLVKGPVVRAKAEEGIVMLKGAPSAISNVVTCHFADDSTREAIRNAFNDQEIIVQGVNTGWNYDGVHLRPCRIAKDQ